MQWYSLCGVKEKGVQEQMKGALSVLKGTMGAWWAMM